jgi:hypothetical protein
MDVERLCHICPRCHSQPFVFSVYAADRLRPRAGACSRRSSLSRLEFSELIKSAVRVVDRGLAVHPAEDILADDRIRRMRLRIFDSDRLVARLLDRLRQFRCEGHGRLHALIVDALLPRQEAAKKNRDNRLADSGPSSCLRACHFWTMFN